MALGIVQTIIAEANAVAVTTASYNLTAGNNAVMVGACNSSGTETLSSSGGVSFTEQIEEQTQEGNAAAYTHMNSAGFTGVTTTLTRTGGGFTGISLTITELSGGETTFTGAFSSANSNSGTPTVTFTLNGSASYVFGAASDWNASGNFTAGTGETLDNTHHIAGEYSAGQWHSTSTQGAGSYTSDGAGSATRDYNIVAIEMREGAGAASLPKRSTIIQQSITRASYR